MLAKTHLAFGLLVALITMPLVPAGSKILFISIVLLGALLPDIDQPNSKISSNFPKLARILSIFTKHRGIFHTLLVALILSGIVWYFISQAYGWALFIGYLSHLIIDGLTKSGVSLLHPFADFNLRGFIETGSLGEWVVFFLIIAGIAIKLL